MLLLIIQRSVSNTTTCGDASDASVLHVRRAWYTWRDLILATGVTDDQASFPHAYRRLGVHEIDLHYQYRVDALVPIGETVGAMSELVRGGSLKE